MLEKFKQVNTFVIDVDGVLTDGSLLLLEDGQMARKMNIKDGYALQLAVKKGYHVLVISGGGSTAVRERLNKLGVMDVYLEVQNKVDIIQKFVESNSLTWDHIIYMGDDMPDQAAMQLCGVPCCPHDAVNEIKELSVYISSRKGGEGCVRDIMEKVLKLQGKWEFI